MKILCVGKKGYDQLRRTHERQILGLIELRSVRVISYETAQPIAAKLIELFENGEFDVCTLFYSRFKSVIAQIPTAQQLIPPELGPKDEKAPVYDYEPDEGEILAQLLPRAVTVRIYRALLENAASFFGAQMSAMDNATRNAGEMVRSLHASLQPHSAGDDHQGIDRDHFGRRGALTRSSSSRRRLTIGTRTSRKWPISRMPPAASPR